MSVASTSVLVMVFVEFLPKMRTALGLESTAVATTEGFLVVVVDDLLVDASISKVDGGGEGAIFGVGRGGTMDVLFSIGAVFALKSSVMGPGDFLPIGSIIPCPSSAWAVVQVVVPDIAVNETTAVLALNAIVTGSASGSALGVSNSMDATAARTVELDDGVRGSDGRGLG